MKHELTGRRPSRLSPIFRRHSLGPEDQGTGRLLNWTRHVDGDWRWYCPQCYALVVLIEEKDETAKEHGWGATRRSATHHFDRPYACKIVTHADDTFTVTIARASSAGHESESHERVDEEWLVSWIENAFRRHYEQARHPASLVPQRVVVAA